MNERSLLERLAVIEEIVQRIDERLFGNGQPGELTALKSRVGRLESWFWRAMGAGGIVVILLETVKR